GERVDVRRLDDVVAIAAAIEPEVIGNQEHDIPRRRLGRIGTECPSRQDEEADSASKRAHCWSPLRFSVVARGKAAKAARAANFLGPSPAPTSARGSCTLNGSPSNRSNVTPFACRCQSLRPRNTLLKTRRAGSVSDRRKLNSSLTL